MAIYSVHLRGEEPGAPNDAVFVSQSFTWKAFFLGPLWLAAKRLWLGLVLWAGAYFLLIAAAAGAISIGSIVLIAVAVQILFGLEANRLLEAKLARRGFRLAEVISAPSRDAAESAFYRGQLGQGPGGEAAGAQTGGP